MALTEEENQAVTGHPRWPALETLTPETVSISYDRRSDTLMVDFGGVPRPAYSHPVDEGDHDYVFLRLDPRTGEVVGLQIEDVIAGFLQIRPQYVAALEHAKLSGISRDEVAELRCAITVDSGRKPTLEEVFDDIARIADMTSRVVAS